MRRTTTAGWSRRSTPPRAPHHRAARATRAASVATAVASLVAAGTLAGCTPSAESADTPTPTSGEAAEVSAPEVSAPVTRVAGRLPDRDRLALRRQVEELVSGYVMAAFVDPATAPTDRFPGFTEGATRLARSTGAVLSRADLEETGEPVVVEVVRAEAPVNVLAPRGRPAGATARLDLTLEVAPPEDDASASATGSPTESASGPERVRLQGRLLLTPVGQGWRVFGFDVRRTDR